MTSELTMIVNTVNENRAAGRPCYEGLSSAQIGEYNRMVMFGENDEAFPDEATWASVID